jgi:predicted permease
MSVEKVLQLNDFFCLPCMCCELLLGERTMQYYIIYMFGETVCGLIVGTVLFVE